MTALEHDDPGFVTLRRMTISQAVDLWLGELERRNNSARTVDTYRRLLDKLCDDYPHIDVGELTATQVRRFLDAQARKRNGQRKAAASIAQNVTVVCGFLDWLTFEGVIGRNPTQRNGQRIIARPRLVPSYENDSIVSVTSDDVMVLLAYADGDIRHRHYWPRRLAVWVAALSGARRSALSSARIGDYDQIEKTLTFHEKGGKTITKPVPWELGEVLDAAIRAGVYERQRDERGEDYLIPGQHPQRRPGARDDRVVYRLINELAKDAGVRTHVHALRAAYAVRYLETHPGQTESLMTLMGHKRPETTNVYLRRLDRRQSMESVRDLSYGQGEIRTRGPVLPDQPLSRRLLSASQAPVQSDHFAGKSFEDNPVLMPADREPSFDAMRLLQTAGSEHEASEPRKTP